MPFNPRENLPRRNSDRNFKTPRLDVEIAELFGTYAGDGCLASYRNSTSSTYRLIVTGGIDDAAYHEKIGATVLNRFNVLGKKRKRQIGTRKWIVLIFQSKSLVKFFSDNGYSPGRKIDIGIPDWIKENSAFSAAFVRGLFDTDGYFILLPKGRINAYPKFTIQLKPKRLIKDLGVVLENLGFKPSYLFDLPEKDRRNGKVYIKNYAYLNGWRNFLLWREKIGSSNPKVQARLDAAYAAFQGPVLKPSLAGTSIPFEILSNRPAEFR